MNKTGRLSTRPFQALLNCADDLYRAAIPYFEFIQADKIRYNDTKKIPDIPPEIWQCEKSLCLGAFFAIYAGIEGVLNLLYSEKRVREINDLPNDILNKIPSKVLKQIKSKPFYDWTLNSKAFFISMLCDENINDLEGVFDRTSEQWQIFEEVIKIRNFFTHSIKAELKVEFVSIADKLNTVNDDFPENYWPRLNISKDLRTFNVESFNEVRRCLLGIIATILKNLSQKVSEDFLSKETIKLDE